METNQIYFNAREIAEKLGVSRSGIYSLMKSSQFPAPIKIGRLSRWKVSEVAQWLNNQESAQNENRI
ncbi:hypothetical protein BKK51_12455 [Rodentibacter trehalosifermentans]|uniref:DNA-binding protein n=1 Tax=Rodentibacter trehalosifermentans TaxID=1908263 RepID=A0A1V3ILK3_9PAST|nr:AlpA family phage regulatory protein [Rodentibacter trehalosifermentans]OOF42797.1 hypothetical protein BKK51_12455 [Rodentibacter trehalosifermentans]